MKPNKKNDYPSGHRWIVQYDPTAAACLLSVLLAAFEDRDDVSAVDKARARVAHQVMSDVFEDHSRKEIEARRARLAKQTEALA
jgi:hypothetical protein